MKRVPGTVTYLQRIALPPAAVVTVKLVDISRQDAPAIVRTEQVIRADGKQVPFAFELAYDPASIDTRFTYAVQAQIAEADAKLLFITDTNYPMITRGNPTKIEIILKMA